MLLQIGFQFFVMSVTIQFSCLVTRTKYAVIHRDSTLSIFQNINRFTDIIFTRENKNDVCKSDGDIPHDCGRVQHNL